MSAAAVLSPGSGAAAAGASAVIRLPKLQSILGASSRSASAESSSSRSARRPPSQCLLEWSLSGSLCMWSAACHACSAGGALTQVAVGRGWGCGRPWELSDLLLRRDRLQRRSAAAGPGAAARKGEAEGHSVDGCHTRCGSMRISDWPPDSTRHQLHRAWYMARHASPAMSALSLSCCSFSSSRHPLPAGRSTPSSA